ncbi:MAG: oligoendopeptidase F [Rhabdochlamydiaceae bacterium]
MQTRSEVSTQDKWNVQAIYKTDSDWHKAFEDLSSLTQIESVDGYLKKYQNKLGENVSFLIACLKEYFAIEREISKLYTYAHMRHDEDLSNNEYKSMYSLITHLLYSFKEKTAWIDPTLLALPQETINIYFQDPALEPYKVYLSHLWRFKDHVLTPKEEELLALAAPSLESSQKIFGSFNNVDVKFDPIKDSEQKTYPLSHGTFLVYLRNKDRQLRKEAFLSLHKGFQGFENTLSDILNAQLQNHVFSRKARRYDSCLEASLFSNQIDVKVYHSLIQKVREGFGSLHRYIKLRKKWLSYEDLHLYDLQVSVVPQIDMKIPYETAVKYVIESVAPLGRDYQNTLARGLLEDKWVDKYENQGKRSGAYSNGSYDTMPYILMNYHDTLNDMKTLAHEAGHSMHSYYARSHQPYQYSSYSIFVAEVASTFNEELLSKYLLARTNNVKERAYLINQKIDDIRATFFRQVMFAEFELKIHEWADQGVPITTQMLKETYYKLNVDYFGPDMVVDPEISIEWARIPHFYYNFYVYQYATGLSAALHLFDLLEKNPKETREKYLEFLASGSSLPPLEALEKAGVNMADGSAITSTMKKFDLLVSELDELIQ